MSKKIVITEGQLKRLVQYQTKKKLNESITFDSENKSDNELNLDVKDGKFVDEKPYNPIDNAHSEHETSWDRMYKSDDLVRAQEGAMDDSDISLNEGQLKLKDTFNKFTGDPIINGIVS